MEVHSIPCLTDNYAHVLHDSNTGVTAVLDPSVFGPVDAFLTGKNWKLDHILVTHHHWDHVGGVLELKAKYGSQVVAFHEDAHRVPGVDLRLDDGDRFSLETTQTQSSTAEIIFIPGHTLGHIAYYFAKEQMLFCGDTLFHLGCGRLFEGTAEQMWSSLNRMASLPKATLVYCAHEYTLGHAQFALEQFPNDPELADYCRAQKKRYEETGCTVPSRLGDEKKFNPFLRMKTLQDFAALRALKNNWRPRLS